MTNSAATPGAYPRGRLFQPPYGARPGSTSGVTRRLADPVPAARWSKVRAAVIVVLFPGLIMLGLYLLLRALAGAG